MTNNFTFEGRALALVVAHDAGGAEIVSDSDVLLTLEGATNCSLRLRLHRFTSDSEKIVVGTQDFGKNECRNANYSK